MIGIFNRSHYEDVLVVKVRKFAPADVVEQRYEQINAFEKHLSENGVTVLKFMLHISKDEQRKRLQARLDDPEKHWKFNPSDLEDRKLWDDFQTRLRDRAATAARPSTRRGASCRRTGSGGATRSSRRSCAGRLKRWTRNIRSRIGSRRTSRSLSAADARLRLRMMPSEMTRFSASSGGMASGLQRRARQIEQKARRRDRRLRHVDGDQIGADVVRDFSGVLIGDEADRVGARLTETRPARLA